MMNRHAFRGGSAVLTASMAAGLAAAAPASATGLVDDLTGTVTGGVVPPLCVLPTATGCTVQTDGTIPGVDPNTAIAPTGGPATNGSTTGGPTTNGPAVAGGGAGTSGQADRRAPRLRLSARKGRLSLSLVKGYAVRVACDEACAITGSAARAGRRSTIARGRARLTRAGKAKLKLRFKSRARRALKREPRARLTIRVTVTDAAGNRAKRRVSVTLKG